MLQKSLYTLVIRRTLVDLNCPLKEPSIKLPPPLVPHSSRVLYL